LFALCVNNLVTRAGQNGRDISELNAWEILKDGANVLRESGHYGVSAKARPVTTCHGIFVDKSTVGLQIREYEC
jgi:hypothetical protein